MKDYNLFWTEPILLEVVRKGKIKLPDFVIDLIKEREGKIPEKEKNILKVTLEGMADGCPYHSYRTCKDFEYLLLQISDQDQERLVSAKTENYHILKDNFILLPKEYHNSDKVELIPKEDHFLLALPYMYFP